MNGKTIRRVIDENTKKMKNIFLKGLQDISILRLRLLK
jgi:hypothetical protein